MESSSGEGMKPQKVSDAEAAFPATVRKLMPPYESIPAEFKSRQDSKWTRFQADWFYFGLKNLSATPKPGIDKADALRHLGAIQGSFEPKHEHKTAAVAYLASLWFEDVTYEIAKRGR